MFVASQVLTSLFYLSETLSGAGTPTLYKLEFLLVVVESILFLATSIPLFAEGIFFIAVIFIKGNGSFCANFFECWKKLQALILFS